MSNGFSNFRIQDINWDFNFPMIKMHERFFTLFHCPNCGIHPQVLCETRAKGFDDLTQIRLMNIYPCETKIEFILGDILPGDVEIYNTYNCGLCGSVGNLQEIPEFILVAQGILSLSNCINDIEKSL